MRFERLAKYKIEIAAISAAVILLLAGSLANRTIIASRDSTAMVNHTYRVLSKLDGLHSAVARMKAASRGYALTGNPRLIAAARVAADEALLDQSQVRQLTRDNPRQQAIMPELERSVAESVRAANQFIALRGNAHASELSSTDGGEERSTTALAEVLGLLRSHELMLLEQRLKRAQGSFALTQWMLLCGTAIGLAIITFASAGAIRDNRKRRIAEEELFVEKERAQITLSSIGEAVISVDVSSRITFINHAASLLTGWTSSEATGLPFSEVFKIIDADTREPIASRMHVAVEQGRTVHLPENVLLVSREGTETPIEDTATPIHGRDGKIVGAVKVFRDVSAARELTDRLYHWAQHDHLTGLPNRILLNDRISQALALAERHKGKIALLYLDLDGFKKINDQLGHAVGDKLLQAVALRLRQCSRDCDTVSRLGGDEFVVVLSGVADCEDARSTGARILDGLTTVTLIDGYRLSVTCSIGIALYPDDAEEAEALLARADTAMYAAKIGGRNACCLFRETGTRSASHRATA